MTDGKGTERRRAPSRGARRAPQTGMTPRPADTGLAQPVRERTRTKSREPEYIRIKTSPDRILMVIILALVSVGSIMVFSSSYPYAMAQGLDSYYFVKRQVIFVALGLVGMTVAMRVSYDKYNKFAPAIYGVATALLVVVLFIGKSEGEAKRWISIGGAFTIQPSEIMKIGIVLLLARYIGKYAEYMVKGAGLKVRFLYGTLYPAFIIFPACALVLLEKHLSGTVIMFALGVIVLFIGGTCVPMTAISYGVVCLSGAVAYVLKNPYALKRLTTFTDENANKLAEKWQTTQGLYAIGSGGLFGLGLGQSRQKYSYVSQPQNDFIFTIWCEEMGYVGAVALIALFAALLIRGFTIARRAPDVFSSLTVYGIMSHITLQAILNVAVVTDTIPNTGISLPFFSYGGSSLIMLMFEMGIVLSISRHSRQQKL